MTLPGQALRKRLLANVRAYLLDRQMLPADGRMLLAVSGGADSTALLLILARLARSLRLHLHVAHFDHGLRGPEEASRDEAYVRDLAGSQRLPLITGRADVRATAKRQRLSLEDAARRARYAFLADAALEAGCSAVATGHTASDQAETVLLNLVRGAGLAGIAGMQPRSGWPFAGHESLSLLRPLLCLSRADTEAYCESAGVQPLQDATNLQLEFRRNRIRQEVLPALQDINPRVDEALTRLAASASEDLAFIEDRAALLVEPGSRGEARLPRQSLAGAPGSLRRHANRLAYAQVAGNTQELSQRHLVALERLLLRGKTGDHLDLPHEVTAELTRDSLTLRQPSDEPAVLPDGGASLEVPGRASFGGIVASASLERPEAEVFAEVDREAVGQALCLRRRRPGDRFQPLGMAEPKKLQDFFVDSHVPRSRRDSIPLFESGRGIAWVGGLRIADWVRPRPGLPTVYLSYRSQEK
jgi:tRNA(Ile)-lysidine synthase